MIVRESGMPDEEYWETLFDVPLILDRLGMTRFGDVLELGCGYGTFSIPVARAISGTLHTYEINPAMIERTGQRAGKLPVTCHHRDVCQQGFDRQADAVLLFNILHCEQPIELLAHAANALRLGGEVLVIHWRVDVLTPRGPSASIRPAPAQIVQWAEHAGLNAGPRIDLPPWHFGICLTKRVASDRV